MNFKSFFLLALTLGGISLFSSCKPDPVTPVKETPQFKKKGIFVVCEGVFNADAGSLYFYDKGAKQLIPEVFQTQNNGAVVGNVFNSMAFINDKGFLVANNSEKIEVVNHGTMQSEATVTGGLVQPRYLAQRNQSEAYVSQWGTAAANGQIKILNTDNNTIVDSIMTNNGPEELLVSDDKLYVPISGGWGSDSVVNIYNTSDNALLKSLPVGGCPTRISKSDDGKIWVSSTGCFVGNSKLAKIENDQTTHVYEFSKGFIQDFTESPDGSMLFVMHLYGSGTDGIYRFNKATGSFDSSAIIEGGFYGIGVDKSEKQLYVGKDNGVNGMVYVYDLDVNNMPTLVDSMMVGRFPNGFLFQD
ncbi:MAG TPA: hypothetical protein ENK85_06810 [Saprospiraceae bacterium]|nr:hypothetical protein [Saprospiraceae bacterium]